MVSAHECRSKTAIAKIIVRIYIYILPLPDWTKPNLALDAYLITTFSLNNFRVECVLDPNVAVSAHAACERYCYNEVYSCGMNIITFCVQCATCSFTREPRSFHVVRAVILVSLLFSSRFYRKTYCHDEMYRTAAY